MRLELHPKQTEAFTSRATEILYGGAAFGGKSFLMRVAAIAWCFEIPLLQVYLFRRLSDDLKKNHVEGPTGFRAMLSAFVKRGHVKFRNLDTEIEFCWNGAKIYLNHCQYEKDLSSYQGADIHVLMMDELTHFTDPMYRFLRSRCRLGALDLPVKFDGMFPRILCGSNPGGIGHNWVKRTFIEGRKPFEIERMPPEEGGMLRQFIPAVLEDNPLAAKDSSYEQRLLGLGNPALVKAMRHGNWNIVAGGAIDDVWGDGDRIIMPRFKVPSSWYVDRSFDWGSSHPFSVLWWAEADGTEATLPSGAKFCPPKGSLVLCHEWYGASGPNQGLKMAAREIAKGIKEREKDLLEGKWITRQPSPGPADNEISAVKNPGVPTIAKEMADEGVRWTESDKSHGTRKIGLDLFRSRLAEARKDYPEQPALYVMDHCRNVIDHWPALPRDKKNPDVVDTNAEDHDYDAAKYRVLAARRPATVIKLGMAH